MPEPRYSLWGRTTNRWTRAEPRASHRQRVNNEVVRRRVNSTVMCLLKLLPLTILLMLGAWPVARAQDDWRLTPGILVVAGSRVNNEVVRRRVNSTVMCLLKLLPLTILLMLGAWPVARAQDDWRLTPGILVVA